MKTQINKLKSKIFTLLALLLFGLTLNAQDPFIIKVLGGQGGGYLKLPLHGEYDYELEIVGQSQTSSGSSVDDLELYVPGGQSEFKISITPKGDTAFHKMDFYSTTISTAMNERVLEVIQWGDVEWSDFSGMFYNCENLIITATDIPNLTNVTKMNFAFANTAIGHVPSMSSWDVSNVTSLHYTFRKAKNFNTNINNWNVSNVIQFSGIFRSATDFNQPLDNWDLSSATSIAQMFLYTKNFNQPIGNWDVSQVKDMWLAFGETEAFDQHIGPWDVSSVKDMSEMFENAKAFNKPLKDWDVSNVKDMSGMFKEAEVFNQPLNSWNVSSVESMDGILSFAQAFDQNIGNWNLQSIDNSNHISLDNSGMSCENYSRTLYGWANNPNNVTLITLKADNLEYSPDAVDARNILFNDMYWNIVNDALGNCSINDLSVEDEEFSNISLAPNPMTNHFSVIGLNGKEKLQLLNLNGEILESKIAAQQEETINTQSLSSGVYVLKITLNNGNVVTRKVVKQ